ncbi:MAG: hypothetical protein ACJ734_04265 [Gaiellaceae bacterium]
MRRSVVAAAAAAAVMGLVFATAGSSAQGNGNGQGLLKKAVTGELQPAVLTAGSVKREMPFFSAETLRAAEETLCEHSAAPNCDERTEAADAVGTGVDIGADGGGTATGSGPAHTLGCGARDSKGNQRVNQDCTFRRQAEEDITYNPLDPNNLLGGQNDSRVGFNQCGIDWSTNNGKNWGDLLPPFRQKLNEPDAQEPTATDPNRHTIMGGPGTEHTYDAGSDPAMAMDALGRGYFSCVTFDLASLASGLYVTQSPPGADGSFFFNWTARQFTVAEDNSLEVFHDKNFVAADRYASSPNKGNVYVTWTVFRFSASTGAYQQSPIFGSMSTDGGRHFSTPEDISGSSDTLCFFGNFFNPSLSEHKCDFNQGSDPVALPNGDLEVIFNNGNTPAGNPNGQQLGVHCKPTGNSATGTAHLNCASPAKVGDDVITGEPQCNFGRGPEECIPGAYIRTNDFPRITQDNTQNNHLYAVWQDYRNQEFDIQLSQSLDGGLTWHEVGTVNPDRGLDHYFPATDQSPQNGDRNGVSYYRTARVPNENTTPAGGFLSCNANQGGDPNACSAGVGLQNSDYVLAGGTGAETPFDFKVLSPIFPPPDGAQTGFNGDYSGLTINKGVDAHPIWSDTRNVDPYAPANGVVHDEDIFTDNTGLPNGRGRPSVGEIGKS